MNVVKAPSQTRKRKKLRIKLFTQYMMIILIAPLWVIILYMDNDGKPNFTAIMDFVGHLRFWYSALIAVAFGILIGLIIMPKEKISEFVIAFIIMVIAAIAENWLSDLKPCVLYTNALMFYALTRVSINYFVEKNKMKYRGT